MVQGIIEYQTCIQNNHLHERHLGQSSMLKWVEKGHREKGMEGLVIITRWWYEWLHQVCGGCCRCEQFRLRWELGSVCLKCWHFSCYILNSICLFLQPFWQDEIARLTALEPSLGQLENQLAELKGTGMSEEPVFFDTDVPSLTEHFYEVLEELRKRERQLILGKVSIGWSGWPQDDLRLTCVRVCVCVCVLCRLHIFTCVFQCVVCANQNLTNYY